MKTPRTRKPKVQETAAVPAVAASATAEKRPQYRVQSLVVGMRILEALVRSGGLRGVSDLARELGATKWVVFRHLQTLCEEGFVVRDPVTERYEVGRRLHAMQEALPPQFAWVQRAREDMHRLRQQVGLTVAIASLLRDRSGVSVIDVHAGSQDVTLTLRVGATFRFHASAHGKIALGFGDPDLLETTLARPLLKHGPKTITNPDALRREIRKVRERGWADAPDQAEAGMNAITAPIVSRGDAYEGSIGIFGTIEQVPAEPPDHLIVAVKDAAKRISRRLGGG